MLRLTLDIPDGHPGLTILALDVTRGVGTLSSGSLDEGRPVSIAAVLAALKAPERQPVTPVTFETCREAIIRIAAMGPVGLGFLTMHLDQFDPHQINSTINDLIREKSLIACGNGSFITYSPAA